VHLLVLFTKNRSDAQSYDLKVGLYNIETYQGHMYGKLLSTNVAG
jgi:hypothetical protein